MFPNVHHLTLTHVHHIGHGVVCKLLQKNRPLESLVLRHCTYTTAAHRCFSKFLCSSDLWKNVRLAWPVNLRTLELSGCGASALLKTVSRLLDDRPMRLPPGLQHLDLDSAAAHLHVYQLIVSVAVLPLLETLCVRANCDQALSALEKYGRRIFPEVSIRLYV